MSYINDKFTFTINEEPSRTSLILNLSEKEEINKLQVQMLERNPSEYIVPMHINKKDLETNVIYDITSKINFKNYLGGNTIKKGEFLLKLIQINKILQDSKKYFADEQSYAIDEEYIFIDKLTKEVTMIYIPVKFPVDFNNEYKKFIRRLLDEHLKIDDSEELDFIERIRIYLKEQSFNYQMFQNFLMSINVNSRDEVQKSNNVVETSKNISENENNAQAFLKEDETSTKVNIPKKDEVLKDNKSDSKNTKAIDVKENIVVEKELKFPPKLIIIGGAIQVLVILAIIKLYPSVIGFEKDYSKLFGLIIVFGAIDFAIMKNIFKKENKVMMETKKLVGKEIKSTKGKDNYKQVNIPSGNISIPGKRTSVVKKDFKEETANNNIDDKKNFDNKINKDTTPKDAVNNDTSNKDITNESTTHKEEKIMDEHKEMERKNEEIDSTKTIKEVDLNATMLMEDYEINRPYLAGTINGMETTITITNNSYIIGRDESRVNYKIDNKKISRQHVEILFKDGKYFVKDMDSRNGTYLNNSKLTPNMEYELFENDRLVIADVEMSYRIK
jgi:hypothetical protein